MTQEEKPKKRIDGGSILLAIVICVLFFYVLRTGAGFGLGISNWSWHHPLLQSLWILSLIQIALAIYVGLDANRRGMQGFLWGALVFFTSIVGLVVYLIVCSGVFNQPQTTVQTERRSGTECGSCRSPIKPEYKICPYCGEELNRSCAGCGEPLMSGWKVCPHCGRSKEA
jgi:hypothetical protein